MENKANLILLLYLGKNNNNPNNIVFKAMKKIPISGNEPPYSCSIDFPEMAYSNSITKQPKKIYPQGLSNLELDKNNKYNHSNMLATRNTKASDTNPSTNIFILSTTVKLVWVIG